MAHNVHVMFVSLPIHGHVNPMLQLAVHCSSMGCNVTFITTTSTHSLAVSTLRAICNSDEASHNQQRIKFLSIDDGSRSTSYDFGESVLFFKARASEIGDMVVSAASDTHGPVTFIVLDLIVMRSLREVPAIHPLPCAAFVSTSVSMMHAVINVETLLQRGYLPLTSGNGMKIVDSSVIPGNPVDLCVYSDIPLDPEDPSFKPMCEVRRAILEAPVLLINSFDELEKEALNAVQKQGLKSIMCIGPLFFEQKSATTEAESIISWLDKQAPASVIYASFGTMMELPAEQVAELANGIATSQQPFLWVVPRGLQDLPEVAAVLDEVKLRVEDRGMIVAWSPQFQVLKHKSIGGFLTHCGWNSVLEALTCGVPMIGMPRGGDHPIICKYVVDVWKVGNRVIPKHPDGSPRVVGRDEIDKAIKELMSSDTGHEMRSKAKMLSKKAGEAMLVIRDKLRQCIGFDMNLL